MQASVYKHYTYQLSINFLSYQLSTIEFMSNCEQKLLLCVTLSNIFNEKTRGVQIAIWSKYILQTGN